MDAMRTNERADGPKRRSVRVRGPSKARADGRAGARARMPGPYVPLRMPCSMAVTPLAFPPSHGARATAEVPLDAAGIHTGSAGGRQSLTAAMATMTPTAAAAPCAADAVCRPMLDASRDTAGWQPLLPLTR